MFYYNTVLLEFPLKFQNSANKYFVDLSVFFYGFFRCFGTTCGARRRARKTVLQAGGLPPAGCLAPPAIMRAARENF